MDIQTRCEGRNPWRTMADSPGFIHLTPSVVVSLIKKGHRFCVLRLPAPSGHPPPCSPSASCPSKCRQDFHVCHHGHSCICGLPLSVRRRSTCHLGMLCGPRAPCPQPVFPGTLPPCCLSPPPNTHTVLVALPWSTVPSPADVSTSFHGN